jgi:hypothetical protein
MQRYPQEEEGLRQGTFPTAERVAGAIPGVLARYESFPRLDPDRVTLLRQFVTEAGEAGIAVTAFIPPVHPAFARAAERTAWRPRTAETVTLLRALEQEGRLRYIETQALEVDTTQFVDAVHFLAPVASTVVGALVGQPDGCALQ